MQRGVLLLASQHGSSSRSILVSQDLFHHAAVVRCVYYVWCLQHHIQYLETQPTDHEVLRLGLENLINISYVEDTEVFKTCLDYWNMFVADIYTSSCQASLTAAGLAGAAGAAGDGSGFAFGSPGGVAAAAGTNGAVPGSNRKALYAGVLSKLRALMINRMAKPEVGGCEALSTCCGVLHCRGVAACPPCMHGSV